MFPQFQKYKKDMWHYIVNFKSPHEKMFYLVSPLCSVKFVNCNQACSELFGEFRPYIINKKDTYAWVRYIYLWNNLKMVRWQFKPSRNIKSVCCSSRHSFPRNMRLAFFLPLIKNSINFNMHHTNFWHIRFNWRISYSF